MKAALAFALIGAATVAGGSALYLATRPAPQVVAPDIGPAALYAASFHDAQGGEVALGRFSGRPVVLNFWATWCEPCREEMPLFSRLAARSGTVQFVGIAQDDPQKVRRFARELGVTYPLWTGGDEVMDLAARLGDRMRVLPFTVILDANGRVVAQKVGAYSESELTARIADLAGKSG